jgi:hypothetical protein
VCTQYLHHIPSPPFLHLHPLPSNTNAPRQDLFCPLILEFYTRKTWHFWLFKIAIWGISLWHFHVYMYYCLIWLISSIFLLSTLVTFLWWFQRFKNSIFILV